MRFSTNKYYQLNLINIHKTFNSTITEYKFFSSTHVIYAKLDYILCHKADHNRFVKNKIIWVMFSEQSEFKVEITNRNIAGKSLNT